MAIAGRVSLSVALLSLALVSSGQAADIAVRARAGMNVRSGPGVDYGRVGSMAEDTDGSLLECTPEGRWCRVRTANATGWIAGAFLIIQNGDLAGARVRDVAGRISFEKETEEPVSQTASTEKPETPQTPAKPAETVARAPSEVCFYSEYEGAGDADCYDTARESITLGRSWNDRIASVAIPDGYSVMVCDNYGLTGRCETFHQTVDRMPAALNGRISSWRIQQDG